jgi:hypothetical protein
MQMPELIIAVLVWLQVKHFVADYLLQPHWLLKDKGDVRRIGGYLHAGIHAVGSIPAYLVAGLGATALGSLVLAEFVVHYVIDFFKAGLSGRSHAGPDKLAYWALHGADQLLHQLTYAALIYAVLTI